MATDNSKFGAQVAAWCNEVPGALLAIRNASAEDVADLMRAYTPIQFGFLAGTIQAALNSPVPIDPSATNESKAKVAPNASAGEVSLVILNSSLDDKIFVTFTMAYAAYVNFGTSKMAPRQMVGRAAIQWQRIVEVNANLAKAAISKGR